MKRQHYKVRVQFVKVWEAMLEYLWVHVLSRDPYENDYKVCAVASKHIIVVFPSYLALLMLRNMETEWRRAGSPTTGQKRRGFPSGKQKRVVESELFLDEYPWWGLGTPHQMVILCLKCSFMLQDGGRKTQNVCATEACKAAYQNLIPRWINPPWS